VARLSLLSDQDALLLLRVSFSAPRVQHLLRCSPSVDHFGLASFVDVGRFISDHALVRFTIRVRRPIDAPQPVSCQAWKRYEKDVFARDLAASQLCSGVGQLRDKLANDHAFF